MMDSLMVVEMVKLLALKMIVRSVIMMVVL